MPANDSKSTVIPPPTENKGPCVTDRRNPRHYREEAAHFRELARAAIDSGALRDSYSALSIRYERLADILEQIALASGPQLKRLN